MPTLKVCSACWLSNAFLASPRCLHRQSRGERSTLGRDGTRAHQSDGRL